MQWFLPGRIIKFCPMFMTFSLIGLNVFLLWLESSWKLYKSSLINISWVQTSTCAKDGMSKISGDWWGVWCCIINDVCSLEYFIKRLSSERNKTKLIFINVHTILHSIVLYRTRFKLIYNLIATLMIVHFRNLPIYVCAFVYYLQPYVT